MHKEQPVLTLLDQWVPPVRDDHQTVPVAFVTTTFTFDADFFTNECLEHFLQIQSERDDEGAAYLIEQQEKLAELKGGMVFVDQHHCRGKRSLRWDLIPCRVKNGIQHAKLTILHWSDTIRMIIGSANLTQSGYCINQEVYSVFDYYDGCDNDLSLVNDALSFLKTLAEEQCGPLSISRFKEIETGIRRSLRLWGVSDRKYGSEEPSVQLLPIAPRMKDGLLRIKQLWTDHFYKLPDQAFITSPFFDTADSEAGPTRRIADLLTPKSSTLVCYHLTTATSDHPNKIIANAPAFIKEPPRNNSSVMFTELSLMGRNENGKDVVRPLHRKALWLDNENKDILVMFGSSNFTTAGLATGSRANYELNVVYTFNRFKAKAAGKIFDACFPDGAELNPADIEFTAIPNLDDVLEEESLLALPDFFVEASFDRHNDVVLLQLQFKPSAKVPAGFALYKDEDSVPFFDEQRWNELGKASVVTVDIQSETLPHTLLVKWDGAGTFAFWPVLIKVQTVVPPVDSLRGLPLDLLTQLLNSHLPLHKLYSLIERYRQNHNGGQEVSGLDPHKLVDTTGFLLQRTKKVFYAFQALRNRLERPIYSKQSLYWRMSGPLGVHSVVDCIMIEAKSDDEKCFLLTELCLELSRVQPANTPNAISKEVVRAAIREQIREINTRTAQLIGSISDNLAGYTVQASNLLSNVL